MRVRGAHEMDVAHAVTLDVVDEDALALRQALVLLARHVLALPLLLWRLDLDPLMRDRRRAANDDAALTASKMFQLPVQRQMLPSSARLICSSLGLACSRRSAVALI